MRSFCLKRKHLLARSSSPSGEAAAAPRCRQGGCLGEDAAAPRDDTTTTAMTRRLTGSRGRAARPRTENDSPSRRKPAIAEDMPALTLASISARQVCEAESVDHRVESTTPRRDIALLSDELREQRPRAGLTCRSSLEILDAAVQPPTLA